MVVRVRLAWLLKACALICFATGVWILSAGLRWAGAFLIQQGPFSHWQIWIACGVFAQLTAFRLNRTKPSLATLKT